MAAEGGHAHVTGGKPEIFRYTLILHLVVLIWGFTGIIGRLISLDSVPLVFYRLAIAIPFIALYLLVRGVPLRLPLSAAAGFLGIGLIVASHWTLFFQAIKMSTVSVGLVCLSTAPFVTALIEPLVFRRAVRAHELVLGVLAVAGVTLIFGFESRYAAGIAVGLGAATAGACFVVLNGRLVSRYDARVMSLYELCGGLLGMTIVLLFVVKPFGRIPLPHGADIGYLLVLGTVCTAFAFIGGNYVMRLLSPFTTILTTNLEPVYGILLALLVFGDSELMSPGFYAGAGVILASIAANAIIVRRRIPLIGESPNGERPSQGPDTA